MTAPETGAARAPRRRPTDRAFRWIAPALLVLAGFAVYANSLEGPFFFDDVVSIVENPAIRQLWPPTRVLLPAQDSPVAGRPVVSLSLAVNYAIGGEEVGGYHAVNVAVHILCALVLLGIVRRTLLDEALRHRFGPHAGWLALACAMIWMVHPIQTECVDYVTQRTESIMALFYLLTLYAAIRAADSRRAAWWSAASIGACALGMASKEVMVTAPFMVLMYDWCFRTTPFAAVLRRRLGLYAGLASTWIILAALMIAWPHQESIGASEAVSHLDYALNQCRVLVGYVALAIWPHPLNIDYGLARPVEPAAIAPYAALLALLLAATLVALARRPRIGFAGVWFFVILSPTSSVIPIVTEVAAERRLYLSLAGLIALVVIGGYALVQRAVRDRRRAARRAAPWIGAGLVGVIVVLLGAATRHRNAQYRDPIVLWQAAMEANPANYRPPNNIGILLRSRGRAEEAVTHFRQALELRPDAPRIHYNLANALATLQRQDEAITEFRLALLLNPDYADAHHNLAVALGKQGQVNAAIEHLREALRLDPDDAEVHVTLAVALRTAGRLDEAAAHFRRAAEIQPGYAAAHQNLGSILHQQGDLEGAVDQYRLALDADPASIGSRFNLGVALQERGRLDEAAAQARLLESLAAGFADSGSLDQAREAARRAVALAGLVGDQQLAARAAKQLESYLQRDR